MRVVGIQPYLISHKLYPGILDHSIALLFRSIPTGLLDPFLVPTQLEILSDKHLWIMEIIFISSWFNATHYNIKWTNEKINRNYFFFKLI